MTPLLLSLERPRSIVEGWERQFLAVLESGGFQQLYLVTHSLGRV